MKYLSYMNLLTLTNSLQYNKVQNLLNLVIYFLLSNKETDLRREWHQSHRPYWIPSCIIHYFSFTCIHLWVWKGGVPQPCERVKGQLAEVHFLLLCVSHLKAQTQVIRSGGKNLYQLRYLSTSLFFLFFFQVVFVKRGVMAHSCNCRNLGHRVWSITASSKPVCSWDNTPKESYLRICFF